MSKHTLCNMCSRNVRDRKGEWLQLSHNTKWEGAEIVKQKLKLWVAKYSTKKKVRSAQQLIRESNGLANKSSSSSRSITTNEIKYIHTLNSRTYNRWITSESKIRSAGYGSKKTGCGRKALYPYMGKRLHAEFTAMREKGMIVKEWWFVHVQSNLFTMSKAWFHISLRRPTNMQKGARIATQSCSTISPFYPNIGREY